MKISAMLKGISGEFEVNRVVGAFGAFAYIVCANAFVAWHVLAQGHDFNVTEYCLAFPAGLGVAVGAIAGSVALKDRQVAKARSTQADTDAQTIVNDAAQGATS